MLKIACFYYVISYSNPQSFNSTTLILPCILGRTLCSHPEGHIVQGSEVQDTHSWHGPPFADTDTFKQQQRVYKKNRGKMVLAGTAPNLLLPCSPNCCIYLTHILGPLSEENSQWNIRMRRFCRHEGRRGLLRKTAKRSSCLWIFKAP